MAMGPASAKKELARRYARKHNSARLGLTFGAVICFTIALTGLFGTEGTILINDRAASLSEQVKLSRIFAIVGVFLSLIRILFFKKTWRVSGEDLVQ